MHKPTFLSICFVLFFFQFLMATEPTKVIKDEKDTMKQITPINWDLISEKKISCWQDNCRTILGISVCDYYGKYRSKYQRNSKGELLERTIFDVRKLGTSAFDMCN